MCVDIVIDITGTSVYGLSEVFVCLCVGVCSKPRQTCLCARMHIHPAHTCALCIFFLSVCFSCVHVEADGSRFGWRCLGTLGSIETCLCVGSRGAGGLLLLPLRPASLTAHQLQSLMPPPHPWQAAPLALFLPALHLGKSRSSL